MANKIEFELAYLYLQRAFSSACSTAQLTAFTRHPQQREPAGLRRQRARGIQGGSQLLKSYSAPAGHWQMDGYGISRVAMSIRSGPVAQTAGQKCWYVLDAKLRLTRPR
jgi:hypothetical protein